MMGRLRGKRLVQRKLVEGLYRYSSPATSLELLRRAVEGFIEKTLEGSVSPFLSYLVEGAEVTDLELAELERLVVRLQARRKENLGKGGKDAP
jgi:predicted transcriptional regulator